MDSDAENSPRTKRRPRSVGRLALGLTIAPYLGPLGAAARYSGRALVAHQRGVPLLSDVPMSRPTLGMASSVALDEAMLHGMGLGAALTPTWQYQESLAELQTAAVVFRDHGWLDAPGEYFQDVSDFPQMRVVPGVTRHGPVELIRFDSGFVPHQQEPGRDRWLSYQANRSCYATVLRHRGAPRPWLIALHGQGMGRRGDLDSMRLRRVHEEHGLNIVVPVLPMHGPRRRGLRLSDGFVSITYPMNNVFGMAQSVWDLQRLVAWLREVQGAPTVGVFGYSLGSYVAGLLATRDPDLACVIAAAPGVDLAEALRPNEPPMSRRRLEAHRAVHGRVSALVQSVVSPLSHPCVVPVSRRFIIAGECDRVATPEGAVALRRHWGNCAIEWQPRGHLMTLRTPGFDDRLLNMLCMTGMVAERRAA